MNILRSHIASVYPRWRGEHITRLCSYLKQSGLSPLARGTPNRQRVTWLALRFIPAGAGNTRPTPIIVATAPVYPRWRGEHSIYVSDLTGDIGLSPLARGTLPAKWVLFHILRFIPAGAGNTARKVGAISYPAVYPRWRGEHLCAYYVNKWYSGLSPLARGTPFPATSLFSHHRFIPAGAGNTVSRLKVLTLFPVYPRWRGEHVVASVFSY